jgi:3-oxoacyl-[acyl-carrier protein] reductase
MNKKLLDRVAIITGANQGLGLDIARQYVLAGAHVMLCARNEALLQETRQLLAPLATENQHIYVHAADVSNAADVDALVEETMSLLGRCHILVNNAGIYGPKGFAEEVNWSEWVQTLEINVYGSILMCRALLPHFKKQKYGKIIQLSGGGATKPLPRLSAYAVSKAAIVKFIETLAEEVREQGIDVNSVAPGALNTRLLDEVLEAGPEKVGQHFYELSLKQKENGGTPLTYGSDLAVFLASAESDGITGKLISAVWDNWSHWPEHLHEVSSSDVYTLRRVIGKDRGFSWADK